MILSIIGNFYLEGAALICQQYNLQISKNIKKWPRQSNQI